MARRIKDPEDAAQAESDAPKGAVFVKNHRNQIVKFADGSTYRFQKSREEITDPELADKLRSVASKYGIFEAE